MHFASHPKSALSPPLAARARTPYSRTGASREVFFAPHMSPQKTIKIICALRSANGIALPIIRAAEDLGGPCFLLRCLFLGQTLCWPRIFRRGLPRALPFERGWFVLGLTTPQSAPLTAPLTQGALDSKALLVSTQRCGCVQRT